MSAALETWIDAAIGETREALVRDGKPIALRVARASDEGVRARADGVPDAWLDAARKSPIWKMAMQWKVAFPLHPEYRTLPMVWYVPPLSPIQAAAEAGNAAWSSEESLKVRPFEHPIYWGGFVYTGL